MEGIKNLVDAWIQWWNASEPISRYTLWWFPIFIWARIGKILELIGALFIVIDWIGRERISEIAVLAESTIEGITLPSEARFVLSQLDTVTGVWKNLRRTVKAIKWMFHSENRVRAVNLAIMLLGFVFDLLGS